MVTGNDIVEAARQYIGARFVKCGRDKAGVDCVGLLVAVARDVGLPVEDTVAYSFGVEADKMYEFVYAQSLAWSTSKPQAGCIGIFRQTIYPMHTGILSVKNGVITVINANIARREVVEEPWSTWQPLTIRLRKYKGAD